jgi:hypothetical protein
VRLGSLLGVFDGVYHGDRAVGVDDNLFVGEGDGLARLALGLAMSQSVESSRVERNSTGQEEGVGDDGRWGTKWEETDAKERKVVCRVWLTVRMYVCGGRRLKKRTGGVIDGSAVQCFAGNGGVKLSGVEGQGLAAGKGGRTL